MEIQNTLNSQSNLEKEKMELQESGSLTSYYRKKKKKAKVVRIVWRWHKNRNTGLSSGFG